MSSSRSIRAYIPLIIDLHELADTSLFFYLRELDIMPAPDGVFMIRLLRKCLARVICMIRALHNIYV